MVCLYRGSAWFLKPLQEDETTAEVRLMNLNIQISVSRLILSASQLLHPHRLVSSNLFSLWLDSALYLRPRQSIKVLNGEVYLVVNIRCDKHEAGSRK